MQVKTLEMWFERLGNLPDLPNVHNLFSMKTPDGRTRLNNLKRYFEQVQMTGADTLLVGEAPGYQGTYRTGVPFCSESIMLGPVNKHGLFGGPANGYVRVYDDERIWKEPSATIVQRTLDELDALPYIWATFPLHPHKPGIELSNRAPNAGEIVLGGELLRELIAILKPVRVIAVGNIAEKCITTMGVETTKVRHPSHGGATQFREQLHSILS